MKGVLGVCPGFEPTLYVSPVLSYSKSRNTLEALGTSFLIGDRYLLTAGHVVREALARADADCICGAATRNAEGHPSIHKFCQGEANHDFDCGIIEIEKDVDLGYFSWRRAQPNMLSETQVLGFPFAIDTETNTLSARGFKGHVVACSRMLIPGYSAPTEVIELSFSSALGLSGAPVLSVEPRPSILGMVVGNRSTKMLIYSDSEVIKGAGQVETIEHYDAFNLGIALPSELLLGWAPKLLGCTIREQLDRGKIPVF
jgi:hypothetical protein